MREITHTLRPNSGNVTRQGYNDRHVLYRYTLVRLRGAATAAQHRGDVYFMIPSTKRTSSSTRIRMTVSSRKWPREIDTCSQAKRRMTSTISEFTSTLCFNPRSLGGLSCGI